MTFINSLYLTIGLIVWVGLAIYLLIDTRKKIKKLGEKFDIFYPFQCVECKQINNYSYSEYMKIVKKPRNKSSTFTTVRNQYLFHCNNCNKREYQEILYGQIQSNPEFEKERRKTVLMLLLKEIVLGISVTAILGLTGIIPE